MEKMIQINLEIMILINQEIKFQLKPMFQLKKTSPIQTLLIN